MYYVLLRVVEDWKRRQHRAGRREDASQALSALLGISDSSSACICACNGNERIDRVLHRGRLGVCRSVYGFGRGCVSRFVVRQLQLPTSRRRAWRQGRSLVGNRKSVDRGGTHMRSTDSHAFSRASIDERVLLSIGDEPTRIEDRLQGANSQAKRCHTQLDRGSSAAGRGPTTGWRNQGMRDREPASGGWCQMGFVKQLWSAWLRGLL